VWNLWATCLVHTVVTYLLWWKQGVSGCLSAVCAWLRGGSFNANWVSIVFFKVICVHFSVRDEAELKHGPLTTWHLRHSTAVNCETDNFLLLYSIFFLESWLELFICKLILWNHLSFIIILELEFWTASVTWGVRFPCRILSYKLTDSLQLSSSWEPSSCLNTQKILSIIWNTKIHYTRACHLSLS
jgi:hypothetical protein